MEGDHEHGFVIDLVLKDLSLVADAARENKLPLNAVALAEGYFRAAAAGRDEVGLRRSGQAGRWSGDNPCSVVGLGLLMEGDVAISLGTSDTLLAVLRGAPEAPLPFGHLFPHPLREGLFFAMLVYSNGDITRRAVRDAAAEIGRAHV